MSARKKAPEKAVTVISDPAQLEGMYVVFLADTPDDGDPEDAEDDAFITIARLEKISPNGRATFEPMLAFRTSDGSFKRKEGNLTEYWVGRDEDLEIRVDPWEYVRFTQFRDAYLYALGQLSEHQRRVRVAA